MVLLEPHLCHHLRVRKLLSAALLLFVVLALPAGGQTEPETVNLLVPVEAPTGSYQVQSGEDQGVGWKRLVVPVAGSIDETVDALERELGTTVLVELRYRLLGPTDEPMFGHQWGLRNTGQQGGTPGADIKAPQAWSVSLGKGVMVAVVDSGVDPDHPDLANNVKPGWDFVDNDGDPRPGNHQDDFHGTFVAGIIAAEVNNFGITGVAPQATILNIRSCSAGECASLDVADGIRFAVNNGADIINLSFGIALPADETDPPVESAVNYARQNDVLVVTAAGNDPPHHIPQGWWIIPAEFPHSNNVSVAATDRHDHMAWFSYYGDNIDIAAPGVDIPSTVPGGGHKQGEGTSYSAPHVAGAAALLLAKEPWITHHELAARLRAWADKPSDVAGKVKSGRLNAGALLTRRFVDTVGHTFEGDVKWAADERVTRGCNPPENTLYCPGDHVTRGQMAAFLTRFLNLGPATTNHFDDISNSTFRDDINRLAEAEITRGCNPPANTRFCPDDFVTRGQMAAFLVRALDLKANTHDGFDDVSSSNTFYVDIGRLATAGITRGCNPPSNTNYCPKDFVTRGQMAAFLHRSDDFK
jgi:hypothetical protein